MPHILIIPPWFDIDYQHHFSKSYHRWARDLATWKAARVGLLYGEFGPGNIKKDCFHNEDLNYHYLGVKGWGLPKVGPGWKVWEYQYLKAFEEYAELYGRPDVIHGFSLLGGIAAGAIHRRHGIPFAYTEVLGGFISGRVARRLVKKAGNVVLKASLVCGISPGMVAALEEEYHVPAQLIPLYIDEAVFYPAPQIEGPPGYISIGSPARTKGMDVLIEAMVEVVKELPDAQLLIVDDIPEQAWLESLISKFQLENSIHFSGSVEHDYVADIIHRSHVLVSASREESLGYTMLEALSCGRPVVATLTPGSQYIVLKGRGEIVHQEDPVSLAKAMIEVYRKRDQFNPKMLHEMIISQFGKEKVLGEWMENYLQLSKGRDSK